jgi:hypothetical protein
MHLVILVSGSIVDQCEDSASSQPASKTITGRDDVCLYRLMALNIQSTALSQSSNPDLDDAEVEAIRRRFSLNGPTIP